MPKRDSMDSEASSSSGSDEGPEPGNGVVGKVGLAASDYEKQRQATIAANRARMEALGLRSLASSLAAASTRNQSKGKKVKATDDDDYRPEDERQASSSSDEDDSDESSGAKFTEEKNSVSKKVKNTASNSKKKATVKRVSSNSDFIDDDDALKKAIALSLLETGVSSSKKVNPNGDEKPPEDSGKNKRKKTFTSRLQMTDDEVLLHFYQFDENWNGGILVEDLKRVAIAHDFTWTDKELADMIRCFDSDGDGKLNVDDFKKIVVRCKMLKGYEGQ